MRLPFGHHETEYTPEQVDQAYETRGWGVKVARRVPRPTGGGEPFYFQFRLPNGVVCTEISDLAEAVRDEPDWLSEQTDKLRELGQAPGVVLTAALSAEERPDDPDHTVTVMYTPLTALPDSLTLDEPGGWTVIHHRPERVSRHVRRDDLLVLRDPTSEENVQPLRIVQYALATELGSIVMTFTAWKHPGGRTGTYWEDITQTVWLGEEPATIVAPIA